MQSRFIARPRLNVSGQPFLLNPEDLRKNAVTTLPAVAGRKGGLARAKKLSPKRHKEIAKKASKSAAVARSKMAKARRGRRGGTVG